MRLLSIVLAGILCSMAWIVPPAYSASPGEERHERKSPADVMPQFLGIPYRVDGVINEQGEYARFNAPAIVMKTPGLNCSGLVLSASRPVLGKNIAITEATRDRNSDSGPDSPDGHDWDFGFDLIMNISEGENRALLVPGNALLSSGEMRGLSGKTVPTWDIHAPDFAADLLGRIKPGGLYLVSFSKHTAPDAPARIHYHVGAITRENNETVWLYGTTSSSGRVIRVNLADPKGIARFRSSFRNTKKSFKRLTVLEIVP